MAALSSSAAAASPPLEEAEAAANGAIRGAGRAGGRASRAAEAMSSSARRSHDSFTSEPGREPASDARQTLPSTGQRRRPYSKDTQMRLLEEALPRSASPPLPPRPARHCLHASFSARPFSFKDTQTVASPHPLSMS